MRRVFDLATGRKQLALAVAALMAVSGPAGAVQLIDGLGGDSGYGELAMLPNDDGSSNQLDLPFSINFYGSSYNQFFINNNGNISFNDAIDRFTPAPFPIAAQPMIAPFWADVDTRGIGNVYVAAPSDDTVVVTWNNVGYYAANTDKTNNFQLVLRDQSAATGKAGDFDIEFRYDRLEWVSGDIGGSGGFGGTPAQAGFDAGNGSDYFVVPGSRTNTIHEMLVNNTNVQGGEAGLWSFAIRQANTPGSTPDNPLMPVIVDGNFTFDFGVELGETVFIDPPVTVGYEYEVLSGPNMATVLLPNVGDNQYNLYVWDGSQYALVGSIAGGTVYDFGPSGVRRFMIDGIEVSAGLDPSDPLAFVTGLTFTATGRVQMEQRPITEDVGVPAPATFALFGVGLLGVAASRRYRAI